jgi:hypothetical protein
MTFIAGAALTPQQGHESRGQHGVDHRQQLLVRLRLYGLALRKLKRRDVMRRGKKLCIERKALCLELSRV